MNTLSRRAVLVGSAALAIPISSIAAEEKKRVLVVVGPSNHPAGTHEVEAGGRLLAQAVGGVEGFTAETRSDWPADGVKLFHDVAAVVFIGDLFPPEVMPNHDAVMADLKALTARGCGLVTIHYACGLEAKHVADDGDHPLLHWTGGYFATRCKHHQSIAKVFTSATIEPSGEHAITRGWKAFTIHDEPYIRNYLGKDGPAEGVSIVATAKLPPEKPNVEPVAWAVERADGGRGAGLVMPHFFRNWKNDDLRILVLNAIVWSARAEVPKGGVSVTLPDLATFKPKALEPVKK